MLSSEDTPGGDTVQHMARWEEKTKGMGRTPHGERGSQQKDPRQQVA